uniref:Poly(A)-specific ribonuclease n=1 Tax=Panagrolaimus sp. JU765 TaxID=591449 RepID=A0AC34QVL7_9BILA
MFPGARYFNPNPINPNNEEHSSLIHIRNVWNFNLDDEFAYIRRLVNDYRFVIFDTEFPGVVLPANESYNKDDCHYKNITDNVNVLKPIQIGICMMNEKGELPPGGPVWQFNFHFNPQTDLHAVDSLDLLKKSGFNFEKHWSYGITSQNFGYYFTTSGLVVNPKMTWITFHSCFDFCYLLRTITCDQLPESEKKFLRIHKILFPVSYDIKVLMKHPVVLASQLRGGLQSVADQLGLKRNGMQHQAGSDSLLTGMVFFRLRDTLFTTNWNEVASQVNGQLFGFGDNVR